MRSRQTLMIDADDTLWENNIYFERAIDDFVALVNHPDYTPAEIRAAFDALEASRIKVHGYGAAAFHQSLLAGYEHLTGRACTGAHEDSIADCVAHVHGGALHLLDGVVETLPQLAAQHTVILVTKGDQEEQTAKLARSGLAPYFHHVEVLREKHCKAYAALLDRYRCEPQSTWMIGNSPRSDINPALQAGLHAVFLPHGSTWTLEQETVEAPTGSQQLLQLQSFRQLLYHFA